MKKIFKIVVALATLAVMQGCTGVSGVTRPDLDEAVSIEMQNLRDLEKAGRNKERRKTWRECLRSQQMAQDYARANGTAYVEPPCISQMSEDFEIWEKEEKESARVILPRNTGLTVAQVANMSNDELCDRAVGQAVAAKAINAILDEDRPTEYNRVYYDRLSGNCVVHNTVKELTRFRLSDYFYSIPKHGYRGYGVGLGFGLVPAPEKAVPYNKKRKCRLVGFYEECGVVVTRHKSHKYKYRTPPVRQNKSLQFGTKGNRPNLGLTYNNTSLK